MKKMISADHSGSLQRLEAITNRECAREFVKSLRKDIYPEGLKCVDTARYLKRDKERSPDPTKDDPNDMNCRILDNRIDIQEKKFGKRSLYHISAAYDRDSLPIDSIHLDCAFMKMESDGYDPMTIIFGDRSSDFFKIYDRAKPKTRGSK